jgi:hypothetical protein
VAGDEPADRRGNRVSPCRHRLSVPYAAGDPPARDLARACRQTRRTRYAHAHTRRDRPRAAGPVRLLAGRALHIERRRRGALACRPRDRRGCAPGGRGDPDPMRGARDRYGRRCGCGRR